MIKPLVALALLWAAPAWAEAEFMGSVPMPRDIPDLGGLSAIEVDSNGQDFVALTDRGRMLRGTILRDAASDPLGVDGLQLFRMVTTDGAPLPARLNDSEGLALGPDGQVFVSFEGTHRVALYDLQGRGQSVLPNHADFARLSRNKGLEALAYGPDGALYTLAETPTPLAPTMPVYRYAGEHWEISADVERDPRWQVSGADFGPDGQLYVLERQLTVLGFQSRVRRIGPDDAVVMETEGLGLGNLEGLSVWRDEAGYLRLTMVADNNFQPFLPSHIVEYRLTD